MNIKLISVAITCAVSLYYSYDLRSQYLEKAELQNIENQGVIALRETWTSLAPTVHRWKEMFKLDASVSDLNGVYNAINLEATKLRSSSMQLNDAGRSIVKSNNGELIGLSKTCLTNSVLGFSLRPEEVKTYVNSLSALVRRGDIEFERMTMYSGNEVDGPTPYIAFDKLCVILRGSDTFMDSIKL